MRPRTFDAFIGQEHLVGEFPHANGWSDIPDKRWVRIDVGADRRVKEVTLADRPADGWCAVNP